MRKISELSRGEKLANRIELIDHAMDVMVTDLYLYGKINDSGKELVKDDLRGLKLLKKGKGYIYG